MTLKSWLAGVAGALTIGLIGLPANAAPTGGLATLKSAPMADVQQAHWYGRRHGYRYYYGYGPRYHRHRHYGYRYYDGPRYHRHRHWHRW
jgi:hypothetical protein